MSRPFQRRASVIVASALLTLTATNSSAQSTSPSTRDARPAWELEVHGGGLWTGSTARGTSQLPRPGATFTTINLTPTRAVPSWQFGDGALLLNQVNGALGFGARIVPLDPALTAPGTRRDPGGSVGFRVARRLTRRLSAEFTFDYNTGRLKLTGGTRRAIADTSASFQPAWNAYFSRFGSNFSTLSYSDFEIRESSAGQAFTTGGLTVDLGTYRGLTPYVSGGAGAVFNGDRRTTVELFGTYLVRVPNGMTSHQEVEVVSVTYREVERALVLTAGGGLKGAFSDDWGWRIDARALAVKNTSRVSVSTQVHRYPAAAASAFATGTAPAIQISSIPGVRSSLSGDDLSDFVTFKGRGVRLAASVSAGIYAYIPTAGTGASSAAGGPQMIGFGVKGGVASSSVEMSDEPPEYVRIERRTSAAAGVYFAVGGERRVLFQPEVLWVARGADARYGANREHLRLNYLDLPLLARLRLTPGAGIHAFLVAGPTIGLRLDARAVSADYDEPLESQIRTVDVALAVGGGVASGRLDVEVRYTHGLSNLVREDEAEMRNRTVLVLAGVRIW